MNGRYLFGVYTALPLYNFALYHQTRAWWRHERQSTERYCGPRYCIFLRTFLRLFAVPHRPSYYLQCTPVTGLTTWHDFSLRPCWNVQLIGAIELSTWESILMAGYERLTLLGKLGDKGSCLMLNVVSIDAWISIKPICWHKFRVAGSKIVAVECWLAFSSVNFCFVVLMAIVGQYWCFCLLSSTGSSFLIAKE